MHETDDDVRALQALIDRSYARASAHLKSIFKKADQPSAEELIASLDGIFEIHLATTNRDGAPRVAPIDAIFFQARIWFGVPGAAARIPLFRRDDRISASFTRGKTFAFIVHGTTVEVSEYDPLFAEYETYSRSLYVDLYGPQWVDWHEREQLKPNAGREFTAWIDADRFFVKR